MVRSNKRKTLLFGIMISAIINLLATTTIAQALVSDTVDVVHYDIHLTLVNFNSSQFSGHTNVVFTPKVNNLTHLPLELWNLQVDSAKYGNTWLTANHISHTGTLLSFLLPALLQIGDTAEIEIYYHGTPAVDPTGWGGFIYESNMAYNLGVGFGADPHNLGKTWFPCVDDFIDRATYEYHITTTQNHSAVCGGVFISTTPSPNDSSLNVHHWKLEQEIPTYLASVAVSSWQNYSDSYQGLEATIPIDVYTHNSSTANGVTGAVVNLKGALESFENRFGPYRWPRVGYVGTSIGAMEHSCNIAFPYYMFNGTTSGETTLAHELAHHWFGNLFTCASAPEMWINEGGASFCEYVFMEDVHGIDAAKEYIRNNHTNNLRTLQHEEGWFPLHGVSHDFTYSSTVYEKGAGTYHSMRGYLGDAVFFDAIKALCETYAYKPIGTQQMCDFLSTETGINMQPFFDAHIYQQGWTHFSVDSFAVVQTPTLNEVTVYVRQKLKEATAFAQDNNLELTFMDENWNMQTERIQFSGETGQQTYYLPFVPKAVMMDLEERFSDATTDYYRVIDSAEYLNFANAYFRMVLSQVSDSAFFRIEHNWVAPDPMLVPDPGFTLSDSRYWKIDGIFNGAFEGEFHFNYNNKTNGDGWLDYTWFPYPLEEDSLVLLHREGTWDDWSVWPSEQIGNSRSGWLKTQNFAKGEYCLAYRDRSVQSNLLIHDEDKKLLAFPNPSKDIIHIQVGIEKQKELILFDSRGAQVLSKKMKANESTHQINTNSLDTGVYFLELRSKGKQQAQVKLVVSR